MLRYWPLYLLLFPALELYVLIKVGEQIGALATLGLVVLSTMAGLWLLRLRGAHIMRRFQEGAEQGRIPPNPVFDTLCLMAAGWLFIFPGFVSDVLALILIFPVTRMALVAILRRFMLTRGFQGAVHTQEARFDGDGQVTWTCTTVETPSATGDRISESGRDHGNGGSGPHSSQVIIDCEPGGVSGEPNDQDEQGGTPHSGDAGGPRGS